ncbi:hypothetical protein FXO38_13915 [Capsicum annuum]|nr:hypothetical protein FXO38_13915 [Capsicum annuum]KAF3659216.1 hypothetical protein FXO37_14046 [Capsicum annuum]
MSSRPDYSKLPVEKVTTNRPSSSKDEDPRLCEADFFKDTELNVATKGLLEKLVHGGYGTVFQEEQSDSSLMLLKDLVVVKRNFSQSCTIGNIQHVNVPPGLSRATIENLIAIQGTQFHNHHEQASPIIPS